MPCHSDACATTYKAHTQHWVPNISWLLALAGTNGNPHRSDKSEQGADKSRLPLDGPPTSLCQVVCPASHVFIAQFANIDTQVHIHLFPPLHHGFQGLDICQGRWHIATPKTASRLSDAASFAQIRSLTFCGAIAALSMEPLLCAGHHPTFKFSIRCASVVLRNVCMKCFMIKCP